MKDAPRSRAAPRMAAKVAPAHTGVGASKSSVALTRRYSTMACVWLLLCLGLTTQAGLLSRLGAHSHALEAKQAGLAPHVPETQPALKAKDSLRDGVRRRRHVELVAMVDSARENRALRDAIRKSWGRGSGEVIFVVHRRFCAVPPELRSSRGCQLKRTLARNATREETWVASQHKLDKLLEEESKTHNDLVMVDLDGAFPTEAAEQTRRTIAWVGHKRPGAWALLTRDDVVVMLDALPRELDRYNQSGMHLIGSVRAHVAAHNKRAPEGDTFEEKFFPPHPVGTAAVSPRLVAALTEAMPRLRSLHKQDPALVVWSRDLGLDVEVHHESRFLLNCNGHRHSCAVRAFVFASGFTENSAPGCWKTAHRRTNDFAKAWPAPPGGAPPAKLVTLVESGWANAEARKAIRDTWAAATRGEVLFLLGRHICQVPPAARTPGLACARDPDVQLDQEDEVAYERQVSEWRALVAREARLNGDILFVDIVDTYDNLVAKTQAAIAWAAAERANHWLLKLDDDVVAFPDKIARLLGRYNDGGMHLVGSIQSQTVVLRSGKWREASLKDDIYPPYPQGAAGYALSPALLGALANASSSLHHYHNEDAAVGLWIEHLALPVQMHHHDAFFYHCHGRRRCCTASKPPYSLVYAHNFRPSIMYNCWEALPPAARELAPGGDLLVP